MASRIAFFVILFCSSASLAKQAYPYYSADVYPDSQRDWYTCNLQTPGYACDPNTLLEPVTVEGSTGDTGVLKVERVLQDIARDTSCPCANATDCNVRGTGYIVSVAVLDKIFGGHNNLTERERFKLVQNFAYALRFKQRRGQCGEDVLIVLSASDGLIFTAVGPLTEKILTPNLTDYATKQAMVLFEQRNYTKAVLGILKTYSRVLKGEPAEIPVKGPWYAPLKEWMVWSILGIIIAILVIVGAIVGYCFYARRRSDGYTLGRNVSHF